MTQSAARYTFSVAIRAVAGAARTILIARSGIVAANRR
jgi:hypothetical protein